MLLDGLQNIHELDLGGERVAVVDVGVPIRPIPAIHWKKEKIYYLE
jgi:hypothetical protein